MLHKIHSILILVLLITGCSSPEPIRVGFAGQLTGPHSDLGVDGRDGALLAVEEINAAGGINGRPLELLVRDDRGDPDTARQVNVALIDLGVMAIIGHSTSTQTAAVFETINAAGVVLVSPTASSDYFSTQDDYFFRVIATTSFQGRALARHVYNTGFTHTAIVYDQVNATYSESFWHNFEQEFVALGGMVDAVMRFDSGTDDRRAIAQSVATTDSAAVILITSAFDTALLVQALRQFEPGERAAIFATSWAQNEELLIKGGTAVEGLVTISSYNPQHPAPTFQTFTARFTQRYQRPVSFAAVFNYEAVLVLAAGLKQTGGTASGLREALREIEEVAGIQGKIRLDRYGDVQRDIYLSVVRDGQFVVLGTIPAEELP